MVKSPRPTEYVVSAKTSDNESFSLQKSTNFDKEVGEVLPKSLVVHAIQRPSELIRACEGLQCICEPQSECRVCLPFY